MERGRQVSHQDDAGVPSTTILTVDHSVVETKKFNEKLFTPIGDAKTIVDKKAKDGITTSTILWDSAEFTRAVFELTWEFDNDKYPSEANNWYLEENPW